jgi:hypothetical protein
MRRENEDYERRMQNWRRWRLGGGDTSTGASPSVYQIMASGIYNRHEARYRESTIPLLVGEAMDTERAVRSLDRALRAAVETVYLARGSLASKARSCGCRREALLERLRIAEGLILLHVQDQRAQRERAQSRGSKGA